MYDQDAVEQAVLHVGSQSGELTLTCGVTDDESAVYVQAGGEKAFFTPTEIRDLLEEIIDVADVEGWLHEPPTLEGIGRLYDYANAVDNQHDASLDDVKGQWEQFNGRSYDFCEDPLGVRDAIQYIRERHET